MTDHATEADVPERIYNACACLTKRDAIMVINKEIADIRRKAPSGDRAMALEAVNKLARNANSDTDCLGRKQENNHLADTIETALSQPERKAADVRTLELALGKARNAFRNLMKKHPDLRIDLTLNVAMKAVDDALATSYDITEKFDV